MKALPPKAKPETQHANQEHKRPISRDGLSAEATASRASMFVDNRPQAIAQRKLQALIDQSPQVQRLAQLQTKMNSSPRVKAQAQIQGRVKPTIQTQGLVFNDDMTLKHEADVMGTKASQIRRPDQAAGPSVQAKTAQQRQVGPMGAAEIPGGAIGDSRGKVRLNFHSTPLQRLSVRDKDGELVDTPATNLVGQAIAIVHGGGLTNLNEAQHIILKAGNERAEALQDHGAELATMFEKVKANSLFTLAPLYKILDANGNKPQVAAPSVPANDDTWNGTINVTISNQHENHIRRRHIVEDFYAQPDIRDVNEFFPPTWTWADVQIYINQVAQGDSMRKAINAAYYDNKHWGIAIETISGYEFYAGVSFIYKNNDVVVEFDQFYMRQGSGSCALDKPTITQYLNQQHKPSLDDFRKWVLTPNYAQEFTAGETAVLGAPSTPLAGGEKQGFIDAHEEYSQGYQTAMASPTTALPPGHSLGYNNAYTEYVTGYNAAVTTPNAPMPGGQSQAYQDAYTEYVTGYNAAVTTPNAPMPVGQSQAYQDAYTEYVNGYKDAATPNAPVLAGQSQAYQDGYDAFGKTQAKKKKKT